MDFDIDAVPKRFVSGQRLQACRHRHQNNPPLGCGLCTGLSPAISRAVVIWLQPYR